MAMTLGFIMAEYVVNSTAMILAVVITVLWIFAAMVVFLSRYAKVGPNQVLVVSGRRHKYLDPDGSEHVRGFRIVKGGGTFVYPVVEKADVLSLELLTIDVQTPEINTSKGVLVKVDGVAQVKLKGDDVSLAAAAEHFLSKPAAEIKNLATQVVNSRLRAILRAVTFEDILRDSDAIASKVQQAASEELASMGLTVVSFTIREVRDSQGHPQVNQLVT